MSIDTFYVLQVSFEKNYYAFPEKPDKTCWARLKEKMVPFVGKRLEHLESKVILSVQHLKILIVSACPGHKFSKEWNWCLYINLIERLIAATSQSVNDRREQMLPLDTMQRALIRVLNLH